MEYVVNIVLLLFGFVFLVKGADFFVASSSSIAKRLHVSSLVIGLTLVAFGTSLPELAVSFIASLTVAPGETADIAMGNVVGSNIVNITLILGLTAIARPVYVSKTMHKKEFPYLIFASVLVILFAFLSQQTAIIVRFEAILLLVAFIGYVFLMLRTSKNQEGDDPAVMNLKKAIILVILGLAGVTIGGYMVTKGAENIATSVLVNLFGMGTSKAVTLVGLSVVAVGTSLPEMVTSIVAAKKGENEIAFGNLVGSNIFNILFILGLSGSVRSLSINSDVLIDLWIMLAVTLFALGAAITFGKVSKKEGYALVLMYGVYLVYIILRALNYV